MIRVEMDVDAVRAKYEAKARAAEMALGAQVRDDCDPYVPYDTGELAGSARVEEGRLVYAAAHARAVYYGGGMRFQTGKHPLSTAQWFEAAKAANGVKWVEGVKALMR